MPEQQPLSGIYRQEPTLGTLIYNATSNCLELEGRELKRGESIEIRVFGSWIPGQVSIDSGGWYLFTLDHVGIRLHSGLSARLGEAPVDSSALRPSLVPPPHILIVDDDQALLRALPHTITLRIPGIQVDIASSSNEALQLIEEQNYDAIVSDIKMPGTDGLMLLAKIRDMQPETPTILITGHGEHDLAIRALRGGAYDYIQKPIDRDSFIAALLRAIQTCQLRRRVEEQQLALEIHARSLEIQVQQRTSELFEANATKDKVISLVSHDLRLPVARLKEMTQLIRRKLDHADVAELVSRGFADIESSLVRTEELVQELLHTSNIDAGQFIVHRQSIDLVALCSSYLETHVQEHQLHLQCDFLGQPLEVSVDGAQITQVLRNIFSAAHAQAAWSDPVILTVQQAGHEAIITVRNLDAQARSSMDLYVSRNIIERHGGHLEVQNFPGDRCTYFLILPLPLHSRHQQPDAAALLPRTHAAWSLQVDVVKTKPDNEHLSS
ncbi:response regulator [Ktedonospora formicarum]|uniref:histidine kinase n=1 Tax=Ktedonospora formicarum TaxID=2778364 RepID=A0A8J3I1L2_9CHLR|nr:response regulator [Ktedonospora formicarum]GHO45023.1 hypothetical protein KSX_31860 [Ktedonospora formicarum]